MRIVAALLTGLLTASSSMGADGGISIDEGPSPHPWTSLAVRNEGGPVRFAVVADRNGGYRPPVFPEAIAQINLLQPMFVMSVGDFITGYTTDRAWINRDWDEVMGEVARLDAPFFYTPGNHDLTNPVEVAIWQKRLGRLYYHFRYRDLLFIVTCTEDGAEWTIGDAQTAYITKAITDNRDAKWTFIFGHKPMWTAEKQDNFRKIEAALSGMKYTVFAGHTHQYTKYVRNGMEYLMLGTTGGGINPDNADGGEFDHVVWVTMTDAGPRIAIVKSGAVVADDVVVPDERELAGKLHPPAQATAIVTEADSLSDISMKWTAKNESPLPMKASIDLGGAGTFSVVRTPGSIEVAPGKEGELSASLKSPSPVAVAEIPRIPYRWRTEATPPGRRPRVQSGEAAIVVVRPKSAIRVPKPVVVDGDLGEWGDLPEECLEPTGTLRPGVWNGPKDGSFRFAVRYDDSFLYAAIRVTDDSIVSEPGANPWDQDGVGIGIDARPTKDWITADGMKGVYSFLSPAKRAADTVVWGAQWMPKGYKAACVTNGHGYSAEIAFPVDAIQAGPDKPWIALRIWVAAYDLDRGSGEGTYFRWTPDWEKPDSWAGSGAFVRK